MSRPRQYLDPSPGRDLPRCACGCGEDGCFGFPGPVHYAFRHWPDGFVDLDERGRFTGRAPATPVTDRQAGAAAPADLFSLTEPASRLTNGPPGLTGRRRG